MKRCREQQEWCPSGEQFFMLPEAVQLLLSAAPCPLLVARLIRLSKALRRRVWDFLCDPEMGGVEWVNKLARSLAAWCTPSRRIESCIPVNYPVFVLTEGRVILCRISQYGNGSIRGMSYFGAAVIPRCSAMWGVEDISGTDSFTVLHWYFVASACAQRFDALLLQDAKRRRDGFLTRPEDLDLFICS